MNRSLMLAVLLVALWVVPVEVQGASGVCTNQFIRNLAKAEPACDTVKLDTDTDKTLGGTAITATGAELNEALLTLDIADLSADATYYLVMPHAGTITKIWSVIDGAVATADVTITANIGATPITNGVVTIATAGSAAGDVDSATPSGANTVTAGQAINLVVAGGGAGGSPRGHVVVVLTR